MTRKVKIVHLEDLEDDADLVRIWLKKAEFDPEILHVDTKDAFTRALTEFKPDIILSDHSLPSINSHEALDIVKQAGLNIPFILVTATVSEEYAVSIIKQGASDYILKDRLQRLPTSIQSALEKLHTETELINQQKIQQRLITETSIQVQEKERDQIGKELHDNINQILATARLYIQMARSGNDSLQDLLEKSDETVLLAISEIRKLSHKLVSPSVGSTNLVNAVQELISDIESATALRFELNVGDFNAEGLNQSINLMFYRIIQEQINNIIKHAGAGTIIIQLNSSNNQLFLSITDDGQGFDTGKTSDGIGLKNIRNRVGFYNGTTTVHSSPGNGCSLQITIPILPEIYN